MSYGQSPTKILIVDDHPLLREGLAMRLSLEPDLQVCGEAATEEEALAQAEQTTPELMLVDISLKNGNGLNLIKQIKSQYPHIKMLVVSSFDESLYAERALRAGALGYLNKQESNEKLLDAVRTVLAGQRFVSATIAQRLLGQALGASDQTKTPLERLSDRELEIFRLIGEGLSSGAIAERLFLSPHTIDTHRENLKRKLSIPNAGELTRTAVEWVLENG
ncbi:MAG: response regulator transcription factor [Planctomycetaceae bacterium]|nr:response regulator transcription factor [Planctomycetaceae bacterium]